jgi:hypothetical protein
LGNSGQFLLGIGKGLLKFAGGLIDMLPNPIDPIGTAVRYYNIARGIYTTMSKAYRQEGGGLGGVIAAINQVNPVYKGLVAAYETNQSLERGDYLSGGEHFFELGTSIVETLGLGSGAVGLARGMGLGGGAAELANIPKPISDVSQIGKLAEPPNLISPPAQRLIPPHELITREITAGKGRYRGITDTVRGDLKAAAKRQGELGNVDISHLDPHVFTPPGQKVKVRPQSPAINRAEGWDIARAAEARRAWNKANPNGPQLPVRP